MRVDLLTFEDMELLTDGVVVTVSGAVLYCRLQGLGAVVGDLERKLTLSRSESRACQFLDQSISWPSLSPCIL